MPISEPSTVAGTEALEPFAVVRVPFPFTDRGVQRRRPAVVLSSPAFQRGSGHLLLAMITTARGSSWPLDWPIQDLASAGLRQACVVRLKLFSLDERLILGWLGRLGPADRSGLLANLQRLLPEEEPQPRAFLAIQPRI